jgi:hypothetical protein
MPKGEERQGGMNEQIYDWKHYKICVEQRLGEKTAKGSGIKNSNYHKITIKNTLTKKQVKFDFWASLADPLINTPKKAMLAVSLWLSDVCDYAHFQDFESFADEIAFKSMAEAKSAFANCEKAYNSAIRVFTDDELFELADELEEEQNK